MKRKAEGGQEAPHKRRRMEKSVKFLIIVAHRARPTVYGHSHTRFVPRWCCSSPLCGCRDCDCCAACGRCHDCAATRFCKGRAKAEPSRTKQLLEKRMDRAIWDAFHNGGFGPILGLVEHGVDPNYRRQSGETALMASAFQGNGGVARTLLSHGADPHTTIPKTGFDATAFARQKKHYHMFPILTGQVGGDSSSYYGLPL